jgi:hypothetical protein
VKQFGRVVLGLAALLAGALLLAGLNIMLGRLVPGLPSTIGSVVMVLVVFLHLILVAVLFLAVPQAVLLHWLGVDSRWAWFAAGVFAGWMFLFVSFAEFRLNALAAGKPVFAVPALYGWLLSAGLPHLLADLRASTSRGAFVIVMLIGGFACAFAWRGVISRLAGDGSRDWQNRILGGPPPYVG